MGSKLDSDIEFQRYHPGCMWGILHILENHHRKNGKKAIPRRKRGKRRVSTCCKDPKTDSLDRYINQEQEHSNADGPLLQVEQDIAEVAATNRTSVKARMQAPIAKEVSGREGLPELELSRHLRSSRYELSGTKIGWGKRIIILQRTADSDANILHAQSPRTTRNARSLERETPGSQSKDRVDVLEIFQVNKKLFLEILHNTEVHKAQKLPIQESFIPKGRLKKSGSFPAAKSSYTRSFKPSTLEHKQMEIWSIAKVENGTTVTELQRFFAVAPKQTENSATIANSVEVKVADGKYSADNQQPYLQGSSKHWWHPSFASYLMKVKQAFKQGKKENGVPIEVPTDESLKRTSNSHHDLGNVSLSHVRRASSLSESMDRYTQLFEHSFSKDAPRHQYHSRSSKLTAEDPSLSRGYSLKTFRRRLSIHELDSFLPYPEETSNDGIKSEVPNRAIASSDTNVVDEIPECERNVEIGGNISEIKDDSGNLLIGADERIAEVVDLPEELAETHQDEQLASTINSIKEGQDQSPVSVVEAHFQDDISRQPDLPVSKDSEPDTYSIHVIEPEASLGPIESSFEDSAEECSSKERAAKATTTTPPDAHFLSSNLNRPDDDDADFNYVRNVLEISGFLDQEYQATWYSLDQPLSPYLFKELETHLQPEESYHQEDFSYNHHHQLLFDLINEALLELFDSSLAYFPKQFSFVQNAHPIPIGNHILNQVWKRISWHQSSGLRMDQSLNDIAGQDMGKGDGWMKLVLDAEDVALDIEDTIFDELLNEALDLLDNCV